MARPTRIEYPGATYLVTTHASEGGRVFMSDADRTDFLDIYAQISRRLGWLLHAYALLDSHYHLLVETPHGDLSRGMRQLNGVYTQHHNLTHGSEGSLFQGRFKALVIDCERHYKSVLRYVLNEPKKAKVRKVERYSGSSLGYLLNPDSSPAWLSVASALQAFGRNRAKAVTNLASYLAEPSDFELRKHVHQQVYLGESPFIQQVQKLVAKAPAARKQGAGKGGLKSFVKGQADPKVAMARAYLSGQFRMQEIASFFGVHYSTVSRAVKGYEQQHTG